MPLEADWTGVQLPSSPPNAKGFGSSNPKQKEAKPLFFVLSYTLPCPLLCFVSCIAPVTLDFQSRYSVTLFARSLQLPSSPPMRRRKATFNTASTCACRFFLRLRLLFLKSYRFFGLCLRRTLYKKSIPSLFVLSYTLPCPLLCLTGCAFGTL